MFVNGCFDTWYNLFIFGLLRKAMIFYFKINMEQSFENGKYLWCIHEWNKHGRWAFTRSEENASVQIERNINSKNNEDKMNFLKKTLHEQRLFWKPNNINALYWAFYYVNDN